MRKEFKKSSQINVIVKLLIFILLAFALFKQIAWENDLTESWNELSHRFIASSLILVLLVFMLMLVNVGIEAYKWYYLLKKARPVSYMTAYKGVICGMSIGIITPNRIGEYVGRMFVLPNSHKVRGMVLSIIGSFSQIVAAYTVGFASLVYFMLVIYRGGQLFHPLLWIVAILVISVFYLLYFNLHWAHLILSRLPFFRKMRRLLTITLWYSRYDRPSLLRVLLLSFLRYFIFAVQYLIILWALGIPITFINGFVLVSCIFLGQAVLPVPQILELGVRYSLSLFFIGYLTDNSVIIFASATLLWVINLVLPAITGTIMIFGMNLFKQ